MMLDASAEVGQTCRICDQIVTEHPIGGSVGAGGRNHPDDVRIIQQYLNSIPPALGGPDVPLAEDGKIGPKTQAAITKYQKAALGWSDGRIDPADKTIRALTGFICDSPTVPLGKLGRPEAAGSGSAPSPAPSTVGPESIAVAHVCLRVVEPRLNTLRWKLTHASPATKALMDKHFATGNQKVTNDDIGHVNRILGRIHANMARANAFGKMQFENVIQYDPAPPGNTVAYTVRGGDKMSTKQFQIYREKGVDKKFQGQSIWLTSLFQDQPREEKHWAVIHEFCHYVGPRDTYFGEINDYAYAGKPKFVTLSKFQKLHNAESLAYFFLECCFGTERVSNLPRISTHQTHYAGFPKVKPDGDIVMS
jgi:hypothetical protein